MQRDRARAGFAGEGALGLRQALQLRGIEEVDLAVGLQVTAAGGEGRAQLGLIRRAGAERERDGKAAIGVIYQPILDELFAAATGLGATLNGEPIKTSSVTSLDRSLLEVGRASRQPQGPYLEMLDKVMRTGAAIRGAGSGSLAVANVAAGRVDACYETHMYSWDCLAGLVLVVEAGGRVNDFLAGDGLLKGNPIFASAPGIADQLAQVVGCPLPPLG